MPAAVPILFAAVTGAIGGGLQAGWTGAIVGLALGAAVGAIQYFATPKKPKQRREEVSNLTTTSQKDLSVPVVFGRARVAGNYLVFGNFHYWGTRLQDNGARVYLLHGIVGLCEGEIVTCGNLRIENKSARNYYAEIKDRKVEPEGISEAAAFMFKLYAGANDQALPALLTDTETDTESAQTNGFEDPDNPGHYIGSGGVMVPWRNTAVLAVQIYTGYDTGLPSLSVDVVGPDFSLLSSGSDAIAESGDEIGNVIYDGYTESWYFTLTASSDESNPWGVVKVPRGGGAREYTPPPDAIVNDVERAWYLGRHDVLVMQDPDDSARFFFGYWGMAGDDSEWEVFEAHRGYEAAIVADHLDEMHGILHTLHAEGTLFYYVMQMNLLTGRVTTIDLPISPGTVQAFCYSPDIAAYVVVTDTTIYVLGGLTGTLIASTTSVTLTGTRGVFVAGNRVGILKTTGCVMWDFAEDQTETGLGHSSGGTLAGHFGDTLRAVQNTWTGHVTVAKSGLTLINFIASVDEGAPDRSAMGSPEEAEFEVFSTNAVSGWIRDWSYRTASAWSLKQLEGRSSVAAAMWSACVDVSAYDSKRWGGGLPSTYFSISSFESLHARCVAGWRYANEPAAEADDDADPTYRYSERYKFDYLMDTPTGLSALMTSEMLGVCNGHRYVLGGKLYVGVPIPGPLPQWHFTENNFTQGSPVVVPTSRSGDVNRIRVSYIDAREEYRSDYVDANDEFDQNRMSRVAMRQLSASGVARRGQAEILAKAVLDQAIMPRRRIEFDVNFVAQTLIPGDLIEITHRPTGVIRVPAKIIEFKEQEAKKIHIVAEEHIPVLDNLGNVTSKRGPINEVPPPGEIPPEECIEVDVPADGSVAWLTPGTRGQLCYDDLCITIVDGDPGATEYELVTYDDENNVVAIADVPDTITGGEIQHFEYYTGITENNCASRGIRIKNGDTGYSVRMRVCRCTPDCIRISIPADGRRIAFGPSGVGIWITSDPIIITYRGGAHRNPNGKYSIKGYKFGYDYLPSNFATMSLTEEFLPLADEYDTLEELEAAELGRAMVINPSPVVAYIIGGAKDNNTPYPTATDDGGVLFEICPIAPTGNTNTICWHKFTVDIDCDDDTSSNMRITASEFSSVAGKSTTWTKDPGADTMSRWKAVPNSGFPVCNPESYPVEDWPDYPTTEEVTQACAAPCGCTDLVECNCDGAGTIYTIPKLGSANTDFVEVTLKAGKQYCFEWVSGVWEENGVTQWYASFGIGTVDPSAGLYPGAVYRTIGQSGWSGTEAGAEASTKIKACFPQDSVEPTLANPDNTLIADLTVWLRPTYSGTSSTVHTPGSAEYKIRVCEIQGTSTCP